MTDTDIREGEIVLPFNPGSHPGDAHLAFIGTIRSPWHDRATCPHNLREALARGGGGVIEIGAPYRPGLAGLEGRTHLVLLYWLGQARRDIVVQRPRRAEKTSGVFALRSPVRPNPIGLATVKVVGFDFGAGRIDIQAIDCLDGTALLDIKPWVASVDGAA